jgi:large subunit ribosomal protein L13
MKTSFPKPAAKPTWYVVDATDQLLGRLCSRIAIVMRGKHRPEFVAHWQSGDHVIVLNADKVSVTGSKMDQKIYYKHTGFFGNRRETTMRKQMEKDATKVIATAVKGMLPKNAARNRILKNLHVYAGAEHKHAAQTPVPLPL